MKGALSHPWVLGQTLQGAIRWLVATAQPSQLFKNSCRDSHSVSCKQSSCFWFAVILRSAQHENATLVPHRQLRNLYICAFGICTYVHKCQPTQESARISSSIHPSHKFSPSVQAAFASLTRTSHVALPSSHQPARTYSASCRHV